MITRRQRNIDRTELDHLPVIELMDNVEPKIMHQISDTDWHNDRLIGCDLAQGSPVEMVEMRMGHENEIDLRQMMNLESRLFQSLDDLEPFRPVRVDQDIDLGGLNQKGSVP